MSVALIYLMFSLMYLYHDHVRLVSREDAGRYFIDASVYGVCLGEVMINLPRYEWSFIYRLTYVSYLINQA